MSALAFLLPGCEIDSVRVGDCKLIIAAHPIKEAAVCPECALSSQRVHSYYVRKPRDLPIAGLVVRLSLRVRRFRCLNSACKKRTFAENLPEFLAPHAQRTNRLTAALYHIGQSLGGAAGARLLKHLFMPASDDTLLRILRKGNRDEQLTPRILGIDDWAFRKGRNYGTILVDLECHKVVDLLPDRSAETLATWLHTHPGIEVIARDRSIEYARGIAEGAPQALQVADRWHLLLNLRQMLERLLGRLHSRLKRLPLPDELQPKDFLTSSQMQFPRTSAEQEASQASRARRMTLYEEVQRRKANQNIKQISEQIRLSRGTVRIYYYAEAFPERGQHKRNPNILDPFLPYLERRFKEGCKNTMQLWREIRALGYPKSHRRVYQWMNQRRKQSAGHVASSPVDNAPVQKVEFGNRLPSVKKLAWLLIRDVESLSEKERMTLRQICQDPTIEKVHALSQEFAMMVRQGIAAMLDPWLSACQDSGVTNLQTFADGVKRDYDAIRGALETVWSNGQTEGQVNRLKMLKRQMYGRAGLDLLRTRVLYSSTEH
ncbi:MAG: ISL3 family transposase [Gammaproteobacteria bacterium]